MPAVPFTRTHGHLPGTVRKMGLSSWYGHPSGFDSTDGLIYPSFKPINGDKGLRNANWFFWNVKTMAITLYRDYEGSQITHNLTVNIPLALTPAKRSRPYTRPEDETYSVPAFQNPRPHRICLPPSDLSPSSSTSPYGLLAVDSQETEDWIATLTAGFGFPAGEVLFSPILDAYCFTLSLTGVSGTFNPSLGDTDCTLAHTDAENGFCDPIEITGNFSDYFSGKLLVLHHFLTPTAISIDFTFWTYP